MSVKRVALWSALCLAFSALLLVTTGVGDQMRVVTPTPHRSTSLRVATKQIAVRPPTTPRLAPVLLHTSALQVASPSSASLFIRYCREAEGTTAGRWRVVLWHGQDRYCYPDAVTVEQATWAASVIKLQIVTNYLLASASTYDALLCRRAISQSDNEAANQIVDRVGAKSVNLLCEEWGYDTTRVVRHFNDPSDLTPGHNLTSAADQVRFLRDLWEGRILLPQERSQLLDWMYHQARRTKIPRYLDGYKTYSKTGELWNPPVQNDVAIVCRDNHVWYMAIFVVESPRSDDVVREAIATLAKRLVSTSTDVNPSTF